MTAGPACRLLHAGFAFQAAQTPDRIAIRDAAGAITYRELLAQSDRIAGALATRGIGPGSTIGLHMERSIGYVAAMLGVLRAQAAVVPLPPAYPVARLREILGFARLDAVIVQDAAPLASTGARALPFAELRAQTEGAASEGEGDPSQTAFVLCSSGSTGRPKLIARSHGSFFHRLEWTWRKHPFTEGEVCVQKSHMTTTHSIYELFEPLLAGVPVHVVADDVVRDLERFWELLRAQSVTRLLIVPSMLQVSLDMSGFSPPPLKQLVLMGEYVRPGLARRAIDAFPADVALYSIYGSTEASSTLVCDLRATWREGAELPLGKPISADVQPQVLDGSLAPVAPGASGLLYMAGSALFTEYFRDPALTEAAFVREPGSGQRLFNTQDQVRCTAAGDIEFVGRVDHTVKVRGFRVDLGEVEKAMLRNHGVRQAVVMLGGPPAENPPLIAFYAPAVERSGLLQTLREHLPPYMVPSVLVGLPSFPLTASGKADRLQLLEDYRRRPAAGPAADITQTESRVADAWQQVLKHGDISPDSNFFEVGGTSLSVFTVVNVLRDAFGLHRAQLSDHSVYAFPTLRQLADAIDALARGEATAQASSPAVAVTLRQGDARLAPLFVIASSGGTLGAYDRLSKVLVTERSIVGLRDPFVWGGREPAMSFRDWISIYLDAMRERQPTGPYYVCAFSSAGAFGFEIARRLRECGEDVAQLILIDPIGIAGEAEDDFGYQTFRALFQGRRSKLLTRLVGWWRHVNGSARRAGERPGGDDFVMTSEEFARRAAEIRRDSKVMKDLSSLFELNTGLPYAMTDADFKGRTSEQFLQVFLARVREVTPDVDSEMIERILLQYYGLQIPATHFYRLRSYDGRVVIFEPLGLQAGLLAAYFRPYVRNLQVRQLGIGPPSVRVEYACANFSRSLRAHYRCMRDETFVAALAAELALLLK